MLQLNNASGAIGVFESGTKTQTGLTNQFDNALLTNCVQWQPYTYWQSYPVYICTDKTKKAIDVLKMLETEKVIKVTSVKRFIELVEKITETL